MMGERRISYLSDDGVQLSAAFREAVPSTGCALLAHGINADKDEWNNFHVTIADRLESIGYSSLRFDFRGHGESGGKPEDMTIAGETMDLSSSITQLLVLSQHDEAVIIATSFGAGPAIRFAEANPNQVQGLILLCPVLDYRATFIEPVVEWTKGVLDAAGREELSRVGSVALTEDFRIGAALVAEMLEWQPEQALVHLRVPVLVVHGDRDSMVPYESSVRACRGRCELVTVQGADHGFVSPTDPTGGDPESVALVDYALDQVLRWIDARESGGTRD